MHRIRAKINAAGPFNASKIGINGDGVKHARMQQFLKHTPATFRFDGKNSAQAVVESHFQPVLRERLGGNNPNHAVIPSNSYHFLQPFCNRLTFLRSKCGTVS